MRAIVPVLFDLRSPGRCRDRIESHRPCFTSRVLRLRARRLRRAGCDLGEQAIRCWVQQHWSGYLRARWIEHLEGVTFWTELGKNDFGLFKRTFEEERQAILFDRIIDRLKAGQENLHIILWAIDWHIDMHLVIRILEVLDINGKRLAHKFSCN